MAKAPSLEEQLAALAELRQHAAGPEAFAQLRSALAGKNNHVVAKAAQIAGEAQLGALAPDMAAAFARFLAGKPAQTDKGCRAKIALAAALHQVGYDDAQVFLAGIRHVQREPVWGGTVDTAAELRGLCALGLVRMNYPDVLAELADLLADAEPAAQAGAARALAYRGDDQAGVALLRLRVRIAGTEPQVLSECFAALLKLAPRMVDFVAGFLKSEDTAISDAAAVALGGSRLPAAFTPLRRAAQDNVEPQRRAVLLQALALLRYEEALAYLLELIADSAATTAQDALSALAVFRDDPVLRQRIEQAAKGRRDLIV